MMHLSEKISFLKGMAEGMQLQNQTKEGRLILELLDLIDDLIVEVERSADRQDELHDYIDAIDEDLLDLETLVYDEDWQDEETDSEEEDQLDSMQDAGSAEEPHEETFYV